MREKAATARKGPSRLGDLDDVFAGKGETVAPPPGVAPRSAPVSAQPAPAAPAGAGAGEGTHMGQLERGGATLSTIRIPHYLSERIANYLHANRGDTMQTLFFKGLVELGIEVEPEDLVPKRQRRAR